MIYCKRDGMRIGFSECQNQVRYEQSENDFYYLFQR